MAITGSCVLKPEAGGVIRHAFLDVGNGELIAFMECNDVPDIAADFDAGINRGLVPKVISDAAPR